jgi:hypothetical protein
MNKQVSESQPPAGPQPTSAALGLGGRAVWVMLTIIPAQRMVAVRRNMKTAQALGITFAPVILLQVTEVIQ